MQMHINLVKHKLSSEELVLINPTTLRVGRCKFRQADGTTTIIDVVKYKHQ